MAKPRLSTGRIPFQLGLDAGIVPPIGPVIIRACAVLAQQIKPLAILAQQAKPLAVLAQRSC